MVDLSFFPSLNSFIVNSKLKFDNYETWVGSMYVDDVTYLAWYYKHKDTLKLSTKGHKFLIYPVLEEKDTRHVVHSDPDGNIVAYSMDLDKGNIYSRVINGEEISGFYFK